MPDLHTRFPVEIETLTPVHIGSGAELQLGYDMVVPRGAARTFRVHDQRLLEDKLAAYEAAGDTARAQRLLTGCRADELLVLADYRDHTEYFRYALSGVPPQQSGAVREQIKDVFDGVYIPGSTIKGALRTSLWWQYHVQNGTRPNLDRLGDKRSWAAQPLERGFFGGDPNHDWLRALHVADTGSLAPSDALVLLTAEVYRSHAPERQGEQIPVEAIRQGVTFQGEISIEEYGFGDADAQQELLWRGKRQWLAGLVPVAKRRARERLKRELDFYTGALPALANECVRLLRVVDALADNQCLLQVGWAGGWESKTLGYDLIHQDDDGFERLVQDFRLSPKHYRNPGDRFPLTRALVREGRAWRQPLGWIKLTLEGYTPPARPQRPADAQPQSTAEPPAAAPPDAAPAGPPQRPEDLRPDMLLEGTVHNLATFGAFVDLGVGRDGLIHVSELADGRVGSVDEVVHVGQRVRVRVLSAAQQPDGKWRIALRLKGVEQPSP